MNSFISKCNTLLPAGRSLLQGATKKSTNNIRCSSALKICTLNTTRPISVSSPLLEDAKYTLSLKTGDKTGAGTDSKVYFRMIGEIGSSNEVMLDSTDEQLERGAIDHFEITSEDVGPLTKVIIRHDNTGLAPGWYLQWAKVKDDKGRDYHFECNEWLAKGEKTKIIKLMKPSEPGEVVPDS